MKSVSKERIVQARKLDLLEYLQCREPDELVSCGNGVYCTRTHDSLKLSHGKWYWWSRGIGGRSALDYLTAVRGLSLPEAVEVIEGVSVCPAPAVTPKPPPKRQKLLLPKAAPNNQLAVQYLSQRGICRAVLKDCLEKGLIYEEARFHNVVFVGFDEQGVPRSASLRGTGPTKFFRDAPGCDKRYSFFLPARSECPTVHLFEGSIDLLSYATLRYMETGDWRQEHLLSQDGVAPPRKDGSIALPLALRQFLAAHPDTKTLVLHYDNDPPGRAAVAAMQEELSDCYEVLDEPPRYGKDVNDTLRHLLSQQRTDRDVR